MKTALCSIGMARRTRPLIGRNAPVNGAPVRTVSR